MSTKVEKEIERVCYEMGEEVRRIYGFTTPLDPTHVVAALGGSILCDPTLDRYAEGKIRKTGDQSFEVIVPQDISQKWLLEMIGKPLGYLFLFMGYHSAPDIWDVQPVGGSFFTPKNSDEEYCAYLFSMAFLMPEKEVKNWMAENAHNGKFVTSELAAYFGISISTALNRCHKLNLIEEK